MFSYATSILPLEQKTFFFLSTQRYLYSWTGYRTTQLIPQRGWKRPAQASPTKSVPGVEAATMVLIQLDYYHQATTPEGYFSYFVPLQLIMYNCANRHTLRVKKIVILKSHGPIVWIYVGSSCFNLLYVGPKKIKNFRN